MNINRAKITLLTAACLALGACEHAVWEQESDAHFGEANRQTMMAQVVDPDPQYEEPMEGSGTQAARALDAYTGGTVQDPQGISTTSGPSGGGSN